MGPVYIYRRVIIVSPCVALFCKLKLRPPPPAAMPTLTTSKVSVEDIEGTLNVLLLVTALTLSFAVPLLTMFSASDLAAHDARIVGAGDVEAFLAACSPLNGRLFLHTLGWQECGLHSYGLLGAGYMSVISLSLGLVIGMAMYISLAQSNVREDPKQMRSWWRYAQVALFAGYALFFCGLIYFFLGLAYAVLITFPWYANEGWFNKSTKTMVIDNTKAPFRAFQLVGQRTTLALSIIIPVSFVSLTWAHQRWLLKRKGRTSDADDNQGTAATTPTAVQPSNDGGGGGGDGGSSRHEDDEIRTLVDKACFSLDVGAGSLAKMKRRAVELIRGDGYTTEKAFRREVDVIDWRGDFPGFPVRVKRALVLYCAED